MSIGRRLTIAFAIVTLIIGCGAAITSRQFFGILRQTKSLARVDDQVLALYRVRADVGAIRRRLDTVSKTHDVASFDSTANALHRELSRDITKSLEYFRETNTPVPGTLAALRDAIDDQFDSMHRLAEVSDWDAIELRLDNQVDQILDSVRTMVEQVDSDISGRRMSSLRAIELGQRRTQLILASTALISAIVSLVLGLYVTRSIVRPLSALKAAAHQFARGDFDIDLKGSSNDELGEVSNAFVLAGRKLHDSYAALTRSNEDLERFAYAASHDLHEPLRTISLFADLLKRENGDTFSPASKKYLAFQMEAAARMRELLTGILEYSRLAGLSHQHDDCVETQKIVALVLSNLHATIEQVQAVITCGPLPAVRGREAQLIQLFQNLIGNAIKYRRLDVPPQIHVSARQEDDGWRFCVQDNGIGIDPDHQAQIFGMFKQLDRGRGGVGIGLAISRRIVEQHGSTICLTSQPGEGSQFSFTLPRAEIHPG